MLSSIQLNHQLLIDTDEVGDIFSNRVLTTKAVSTNLLVA